MAGVYKYKFKADKQVVNQNISPRKGHTIGQLRALQSAGWHNADTGKSLSQGEGEHHLAQLEQHRADRIINDYAKRLSNAKTRSRGREWIPAGQVTFRRIHGHIVPFRKKEEPFL